MAQRIPQLDWSQISPAPVVLVSGKESYLAGRAMQRLRAVLALEDPALEVTELRADDYASGELVSLASPSLFGEPRLVKVERVQNSNDAFLADALDYLAHPADDAVLVLRHDGSSVRGKKLLDAVRSTGGCIEVVCAPLKGDAQYLAFARDEFRAARRSATPGALRALVQAFSSDLAGLAGACGQLMDDSSDEITEQTVQRYYAGRVETTAFDVADAVIAGDAARALVMLRQALDTGADPVPIVAAFAMRFRQLAKVSAVGGSDAQVAKQLGMAPWQVQQARRDVRRFDDAALGVAMETIARTDAAVKGFEPSPIFALERMIARLARR